MVVQLHYLFSFRDILELDLWSEAVTAVLFQGGGHGG